MNKQDILAFQGNHRFLSNFWKLSIPVNFENIQFFTTEAAYVAAKTTNEHLRRAIAEMTPGKAKKFGPLIFEEKLWSNPGWNDGFRLELMKDLVFQKFSKCAGLKMALLDTGDVQLVEGNTWHDNFFGVCSCEACNKVGANHLGKILMNVRNELR